MGKLKSFFAMALTILAKEAIAVIASHCVSKYVATRNSIQLVSCWRCDALTNSNNKYCAECGAKLVS